MKYIFCFALSLFFALNGYGQFPDHKNSHYYLPPSNLEPVYHFSLPQYKIDSMEQLSGFKIFAPQHVYVNTKRKIYKPFEFGKSDDLYIRSIPNYNLSWRNTSLKDMRTYGIIQAQQYQIVGYNTLYKTRLRMNIPLTKK